jgi:hypothetical protein
LFDQSSQTLRWADLATSIIEHGKTVNSYLDNILLGKSII